LPPANAPQSRNRLKWISPGPARAFSAGKVNTIRILSDFVTGESGSLDGEIGDPTDPSCLPSGDGSAGGDAVLELPVP
jgi:hypothetical protein